MQAKTLQEFIALAKAEPGKLAYASSGPGTPYHMAGELFKAMSGTDILHVPHKNSGEARNAVIGGHVQMMFDAVTAMKRQHRRAARCARSAPPGEKRSAVLPDVPTVSEAGVPGYEATIWLGIMAPSGTPKEIVDRLNAEIAKIIAKPAIREAWAKQGAVPMTMTPAQFDAFLQARHRQVGQGDPAGRHQDAMKTLRILSGGAAQGLVEALQPVVRGRDRLHDRRRVRRRRRHEGDRLLAGEPADLMILSRALIDELAHVGAYRSCRRSGISAPVRDSRSAVRRGDCRPRVGSAGELRAALRGRRRDPLLPDAVPDRRHPLRQGVMRELAPGRSSPTDCGPAANGAAGHDARFAASTSAAAHRRGTQATEILSTTGASAGGGSCRRAAAQWRHDRITCAGSRSRRRGAHRRRAR